MTDNWISEYRSKLNGKAGKYDPKSVVARWAWNNTLEECREEIAKYDLSIVDVIYEMRKYGFNDVDIETVTGVKQHRCKECGKPL